MNFEKVARIIPLASQTYSKSHLQFPMGPNFLTNGLGCKVKADNGKTYTDWIMGLGAITLGYRDKAVEQAICLQAINGITFSLPHPIEYELAKLIIKHIKGAEMVRFAKNGSDVTSAAVRLARAFTKRDHIAMCGYHGSQDWSICTTSMGAGVPHEVRNLTHRFDYNNLSQLENLFHNYALACVIMEPMNSTFPVSGYLEEVQRMCRDNGAILIFDEVVTGFRFGLGGAGELLGVCPDITCLGKGVANGMPLSVLTGRRDIMSLIEKDVFMSSTFGGETLSIAAAIATIMTMEKRPVHRQMMENGQYLMDGAKRLGYEVSGHPNWSFLKFKDAEAHTLFKQECIKKGQLISGTHNMSYSHSRKDCDNLLQVYKDIRGRGKLKCKPINPVFSVR